MEYVKAFFAKLLEYIKMPLVWLYGSFAWLRTVSFTKMHALVLAGVVALALVIGYFVFFSEKKISQILPAPVEISKNIFTKSEPAKTVTVEWNAIKNHYYSHHEVDLPKGNVVTVCSAHSCQKQTKIRLNDSFLSDLSNIMSESRDEASERNAIKKAVALFEAYVGNAIGTSKDRPGTDFFGSGDPTQLDSVDEATNVTSLLLVMADKGLLKYHGIKTPYWKLVFGNQYAAIIQDLKTERHWIIDSNVGVNGDEPLVIELVKWKNL